jgi:predicted transcriptional regulator
MELLMDSTIPWPKNRPKQSADDPHARGRKQVTATGGKKNVDSTDVPTLVKPALGPLEWEVLQQVCGFGESSVRQVLERMPRPLAYTTVMTTMSRLYRKGLLNCRRSCKTFLYTSRLSPTHLELQFARDLVGVLVQCKETPMNELADAIIEVMARDHPALLSELRLRLTNVLH